MKFTIRFATALVLATLSIAADIVPSGPESPAQLEDLRSALSIFSSQLGSLECDSAQSVRRRIEWALQRIDGLATAPPQQRATLFGEAMLGRAAFSMVREGKCSAEEKAGQMTPSEEAELYRRAGIESGRRFWMAVAGSTQEKLAEDGRCSCLGETFFALPPAPKEFDYPQGQRWPFMMLLWSKTGGVEGGCPRSCSAPKLAGVVTPSASIGWHKFRVGPEGPDGVGVWSAGVYEEISDCYSSTGYGQAHLEYWGNWIVTPGTASPSTDFGSCVAQALGPVSAERPWISVLLQGTKEAWSGEVFWWAN